ncbi:MAG: cell filamentation protein Fic [Bacteroidetes bacterium GWA2_31_9b]|nr:MAG: cell filamentation protein Fic [Bacteroidetes bacterium GWA2_31_9b]
MDSKDFKSGSYIQQQGFKSFYPEQINHEWIISDPKLTKLLTEASRSIGKLDMFSEYIPNIDLFISMHVTKEATQSSKIEGTKTNIEEALLNEKNIDPEKKDDWEEVQNYINALNMATSQLEKLPFSNKLIKDIHKSLLKGVRGENKMPGEFRRSQNWIGGATLKDAVFVPPPHTEVIDLMSDLEKFLNNDKLDVPELIRIAIAHYYFETIHPFLDGNGRIGRLIIILYLIDKKIIKKPILYLSDFFDKHRTIYYDNLMAVRNKNDLNQWLRFFLSGIIETSEKSISTFNKILNLKAKTDEQILKLGSKAKKAKILLDELYKKPIIEAFNVSETLGVSNPTAYSYIKEFKDLGILVERTGFQRNQIFVFQKYLDLFL